MKDINVISIGNSHSYFSLSFLKVAKCRDQALQFFQILDQTTQEYTWPVTRPTRTEQFVCDHNVYIDTVPLQLQRRLVSCSVVPLTICIQNIFQNQDTIKLNIIKDHFTNINVNLLKSVSVRPLGLFAGPKYIIPGHDGRQ